MHMFPILNPPPSSLPILSLWVIPVHQPQASSIVHRTWTGDSFPIWYYTYFNAILPNHPTLSLSHRVQKTVLFLNFPLFHFQLLMIFLKSIKEKQSSVQFSSVAQSCPTLYDPMNLSTPGLPVHHQLPEFIQTHVHWVGDAIQPSHPLSSPSPSAPNPSQHQSLFQWVNSLHEVAKVLEFQL